MVGRLVDSGTIVGEAREGREGGSGRFKSGNLCRETFAGRGSCLAVGLDLVVSEKLTYTSVT